MGLLNEGISEVIVTTDKNAAPIGIRYSNGIYSMILFRGTHTEQNVRKGCPVVANILFDPILFVRTAFEDPGMDAFCSFTVNEKSLDRLAAAEAWVVFRPSIEKETPEAINIRLAFVAEGTATPGIHPVNRGFNSIIDAAVHGTRYRLSRDPELRKLIEYHAIIIRKCGGPREQEALGLLMKYIS